MTSYSCPSNRILGAGKYIWPSWRRAMTAQTWVEVPGNVLNDINPANDPTINPNHPGTPEWSVGDFNRIISAWCGACFDQSRCYLWLPLNGGHGDYAGNEPYRAKLDQDSVTWEMVRPPTGALPGAVVTDDNQEATGLYADGRIRAVHTYSTPVHVPGLGVGLITHGAPSWSASPPNGKPVIIDEHTGELITYGADMGVISSEANGCYDPVRHCFWAHERGGSRIEKYDIATDSWSAGSSFGSSSGPAQLVYLGGEDLVFVRRGSSTWAIFDPSDRTLTTISSTGTGVLDSTAQDALPSWCEYDRCLYLWDQSANTDKLTKIQAPADPKSGTWVVSTVTPDASNAVTPSAKTGAGTYGRFGYSKRLDGFYLLNAVTQPIYFFARTA